MGGDGGCGRDVSGKRVDRGGTLDETESLYVSFEKVSWERFREDVRNLGRCRTIRESNCSVSNLVSRYVVSDTEVFGTFMECGILR
jgi:hypothetical protein